MTLYAVMLFLHLVGVLMLFAAFGLEWICLGNLRRAASLEQFRSWGKGAAVLPRFHAFSGPLVIFPGAYLATKMKAWPQVWMSLSLVAVVVIMILGMAVTSRRMRAMLKASMQDGATLPDLVNRAFDPVLRYSFRLRVALGLGVVYLMGSKAGTNVSLAVMGIATIAGLIAAAKAPQASGNAQGVRSGA